MLRSRLLLHAACLLLLRDAVIPVHCLPDADVGGPAFYFEQRYFLHSAQISDQLNFRKNERARHILERIAASYQLDVARDFMRDENASHLPLLVSTRFVLCWLLERRHMALHHSRWEVSSSSSSWSRLLDNYFEAAAVSLHALPDALPTLEVAGVSIPIDKYGNVSLVALAQMWPGMQQEWSEIADNFAGFQLPSYPAGQSVQLSSLLVFLDCRTRFSDASVDASDPTTALRGAVVQVMSWLVELHVLDMITVTHERSDGRDARVTELFGPSDRYRMHHRALERKNVLQQMKGTYGCKETISRTLSGVHGTANESVVAGNKLYKRSLQCAFKHSTAVALGYDGSCHGGSDTLVGFAMDVPTEIGGYLEPTVVETQPFIIHSIVLGPGRAV